MKLGNVENPSQIWEGQQNLVIMCTSKEPKMKELSVWHNDVWKKGEKTEELEVITAWKKINNFAVE